MCSLATKLWRKFSLLGLDFPSFPVLAFAPTHFLSSMAFTGFHKFLYVLFPFLFSVKYLNFFLLSSSLSHSLVGNVMFKCPIFMYFPRFLHLLSSNLIPP